VRACANRPVLPGERVREKRNKKIPAGGGTLREGARAAGLAWRNKKTAGDRLGGNGINRLEKKNPSDI